MFDPELAQKRSQFFESFTGYEEDGLPDVSDPLAFHETRIPIVLSVVLKRVSVNEPTDPGACACVASVHIPGDEEAAETKSPLMAGSTDGSTTRTHYAQLGITPEGMSPTPGGRGESENPPMVP